MRSRGRKSTLEDRHRRPRRRGARSVARKRRPRNDVAANPAALSLREGPHRTAEELAEEVQRVAPDVHLSTIYRNLDELERLGIIVHAHLGHGPATYHLSSETHGHLVCEQCGMAIEAPEDIFRRARHDGPARLTALSSIRGTSRSLDVAPAASTSPND